MIAAVLAHQGGWDEALMVAAPVALFVVLLRVANARAADQDSEDVGGPDLGGAGGDVMGDAHEGRDPSGSDDDLFVDPTDEPAAERRHDR